MDPQSTARNTPPRIWPACAWKTIKEKARAALGSMEPDRQSLYRAALKSLKAEQRVPSPAHCESSTTAALACTASAGNSFQDRQPCDRELSFRHNRIRTEIASPASVVPLPWPGRLRSCGALRRQ